jgi:hypothetical protein
VCADTPTLGFKSAIYAGMTDDEREVTEEKRAVMDLMEPCFASWRGVTVHNFVTSVALAA